MEATLLLANLGALVCLGLGGMGLLAPRRAAEFTSVAPVGKLGLSEMRATYGGLFAALGGVCLLQQSEPVFLAAGVAWLGAAGGRLFSALFDASWSARNVGGIGFEACIGLLLLAPALVPA